MSVAPVPHEVLCAFQWPLPPSPVLYLPDIDEPETEPVYVAPAPTAPNVMAKPRTFPEMPYVPCGRDSVILPVRAPEAFCLQWMVNVPEYDPL